jgi:hypothetical protein
MRKIARDFAILGLIFVFAFCLTPSQVSAVQMKRHVLNGGGAMWLETASYKLSSSLGQSIIGTQDGATKDLYTGFWNPWVVQMTPVEWEEVEGDQLPREFGLSQNFPNPFNPATVIEYALPRGSEVKIQIYNVLGQKVRTLVDEHQEPGYKMIRWDGKDDSRTEVSSGIYFYRIVAHTVHGGEDFVKCRKMTLLK